MGLTSTQRPFAKNAMSVELTDEKKLRAKANKKGDKMCFAVEDVHGFLNDCGVLTRDETLELANFLIAEAIKMKHD